MALNDGLAIRSIGEVAELLHMEPIRVVALERSALRKLAENPETITLVSLMHRLRRAEDRRQRSTWSVMSGA